MIRNLAQCPHCGKCEIALSDARTLLFNPDGDGMPCAHLAWLDGRYCERDNASERGRVIGSVEFRWSPQGPETEERDEALFPFLKELARQGSQWAFAPLHPFNLQLLDAEERHSDEFGNSRMVWEVDGWVIFAPDPAAFWAELPACQEQQREGLRVTEPELVAP